MEKKTTNGGGHTASKTNDTLKGETTRGTHSSKGSSHTATAKTPSTARAKSGTTASSKSRSTTTTSSRGKN